MAQINKASTPFFIYRTQDYLSRFNINPIPNINGRFLPLIDPFFYQHNFEHFVALYLDKVDTLTPEQIEWGNVRITRLVPSSSGYQALDLYSKTVYGGAVIGELIRSHVYYNHADYNNDRSKFIISQGIGSTAKGDTGINVSSIFLPAIFPGKETFQVGGQRIDPLAVIHHEFRHTALWRGFLALNITLEHERQAVIQAENPVRLMNGYEPRYVYYRSAVEGESNSDQTINIATGEIKPGKYTFDPYNITKLIKSEHA